MRNQITAGRKWIALSALLLLVVSASASAQTPGERPLPSPDPCRNQTPSDLFGQLNLTEDQVQKICTINADLREERQIAALRLRLTRRELDAAINSATPDEKLIEQRSKAFADAQAAMIRVSSLTEARVLQVLTPEQRQRVREIRQRNQALRRQNNQQRPPRDAVNQNSLQRPRNSGPGTLGPRRRPQP